ncbi:CRISPR-associated primase-polymerase type A1 [Desulfolithobacter sp.]
MAQQHSPQVARESPHDFRLLLTRLKNAPLDDSGQTFVREALANNSFLEHLGEDDLLLATSIAQQHGLIAESLAILERLTGSYPENNKGWDHYLSTLDLLGDRKEFIRVLARATEVLPEEMLRKWSGPQKSSHGFFQEPEPTDQVTAPFTALRREEENVSLYLRLFRGREDAFARQWADRREERQGYVPVRRAMQADDVREHLAGQRTYGIYLLTADNMVHTGVIDVDLIPRLRDRRMARKHRSEIRREAVYLHTRIHELASGAGLCCLAEVSGGKGYHFWFPVREPVPAGIMRQALQHLCGTLEKDVQCFGLEVFPKQDSLRGKGFGNLVKLPLGIHRGTGKPSWFVRAKDRSVESQFDLLRTVKPAPASAVSSLAAQHKGGEVLVHPRHADWAREYPELAVLEERCAMLGQIMASLRASRTLSIKEEKIVLGTIGHLPRARILAHHLFSRLPEYNRALLDYKLSRVRGTVLGCKRIHSLMEQGGGLPCEFEGSGYPHPLRHIKQFKNTGQPRSERIENLRDALDNLKAALRQVERFMGN